MYLAFDMDSPFEFVHFWSIHLGWPTEYSQTILGIIEPLVTCVNNSPRIFGNCRTQRNLTSLTQLLKIWEWSLPVGVMVATVEASYCWWLAREVAEPLRTLSNGWIWFKSVELESIIRKFLCWTPVKGPCPTPPFGQPPGLANDSIIFSLLFCK